MAVLVLALLGPRLVERYVSMVPSRWWPAFSGLGAIAASIAVATWSPLQVLLLSMPKSPVAAIFAIAAAGVTYWAYSAAHEREAARELLPLQVNVTQIQGGPWDVDDWTTGKDGNPGVLHGSRIILSRVEITNRSPTDRMNLRFRLHVSLVKKDGSRSPFVIDEHVGRPQAPPADAGPPLRGPLDLGPQSTAEGSISFYVIPGVLLLVGEVSYDPHVGGNTLTVTDLVSGKSRNFRVPTSMGGTVNVIH